MADDHNRKKNRVLDFSQPWREKYFSGEPLEIGNKVQLLFDDYIVEDRFGLRRIIGPVEKYSNKTLYNDPPLSAADELCTRPSRNGPLEADGDYALVHDSNRSQWLLYGRPRTTALIGESRTRSDCGNRADEFYHDFHDKKRVAVCMSKDMKQWTYPRCVIFPDEIDASDVDSIKVFKYRDIFLGFIGLMDNNPAKIAKHTHLMWSRDGLHWERLPDRPRFIDNNGPWDWDTGSISVTGMVPDGDRINIYYRTDEAANNLASVGKDRFIGQQAGPEGGYLLTRQFILKGDRLEINCFSPGRLQRPGHGHLTGLGIMIKAELLQPPFEHHSATPYSGFSMDECDGISTKDEIRQVVTWNGSANLSALRGQKLYIRFYLRNTTLYSFRITNRLN